MGGECRKKRTALSVPKLDRAASAPCGRDEALTRRERGQRAANTQGAQAAAAQRRAPHLCRPWHRTAAGDAERRDGEAAALCAVGVLVNGEDDLARASGRARGRLAQAHRRRGGGSSGGGGRRLN